MTKSSNIHINNTTHLESAQAIVMLRFPLTIFIIFLHCYSTVSIPGNHVLYFKFIYPFSLWLGETGVPCFFFISGYLFFLSQKTYKHKIESRIYTLLVPYFLWNIILLVIYLLFSTIGYPQQINGRFLSDYTWKDYILLFWNRGSYDNGNFSPLLCPLWYIRNLFIISCLSPLLFYLIKYLREPLLIAMTMWWFLTPHNAFIQQTFLFFSMGAYFPIHYKDPIYFFKKHHLILLSALITFCICDIVTHTIYPISINLQLHRLALTSNIPGLFLLAEICSKRHPPIDLLTNSSFVVFCVHYPIAIIIRKLCVVIFPNCEDLIHITLYFCSVVITSIISIGIYQVLNYLSPSCKKILSGNR